MLNLSFTRLAFIFAALMIGGCALRPTQQATTQPAVSPTATPRLNTPIAERTAAPAMPTNTPTSSPTLAVTKPALMVIPPATVVSNYTPLKLVAAITGSMSIPRNTEEGGEFIGVHMGQAYFDGPGNLLWRTPLKSEKINKHEELVKTKYSPFIYLPLQGNWAVSQQNSSIGVGNWSLDIINLETKKTRPFMDASMINGIQPDMEILGDTLVMSYVKEDEKAACLHTSILEVMDIPSSKRRILDQACTTEYMWSRPTLNKDFVFVERGLPRDKGGGYNIFAFDLASGTKTQLTTDNNSSGPYATDDFLAWSHAQRFDQFAESISIYALKSNAHKRIKLHKELIMNPNGMSGDWVMLSGSIGSDGGIYAYNLKSGQIYEAAVPEGATGVAGARTNNRVLYWVRDPDPEGTPKNLYIEWAEIP